MPIGEVLNQRLGDRGRFEGRSFIQVDWDKGGFGIVDC
jgi:hypothetical protein